MPNPWGELIGRDEIPERGDELIDPDLLAISFDQCELGRLVGKLLLDSCGDMSASVDYNRALPDPGRHSKALTDYVFQLKMVFR